MQDIDPVLFIAPLATVVFSAILVVWWHYKRRLTATILVVAALAYFTAIGLKVVVQGATYGWIQSTFGTVSVPAGLYFGLQTSFFEVGLAYVVARFAISHWNIDARDGEGYGVSLAFWENGILTGALSLFSLALTYVFIAEGLLPQSTYQTMVTSQPSVFYPPSQLLFATALSIVERFSSFLIHFSWGYLCVLAAYFHKRNYLFLALPMGLVDALVPFAGEVPLWAFELAILLIALGAFAVTWRVTERDRHGGYAKELTASTPSAAA